MALLFFLVKISPPVRIYLYQEVAEVRIVSPEKMYVPQIDKYLDSGSVSGILSHESPGESLSNVGEERFSESEMAEGQASPSIRVDKDKMTQGTTSSGWVLPFRLGAPSGKGSSFRLGIGNKELKATDEFEGAPKDKLNLSGFRSGGLSSIQFNRIKSRKDIRGTRASPFEQRILDGIESFDISPWVKKVVDKIRNNWSVPPIKESLAMGEMKIFISVRKNGELLDFEIMDSSDLVQFDETALEAVQSSLPFPPLPDEYPYEKLEALLVFQFNE